MIIPTIVGVPIVGLLFASIPVIHIALKNNPKALNIVSKIMLALYMLATITFTMTQVSIGQQNIIVNFAATGDWFSKVFDFSLANIQLKDFLINIALTYPIGYAVATNSKSSGKGILYGLAAGFATGLMIEILQFSLPVNRYPSLSDIILNSFSGLIGSTACVATSKIYDAVKNKFFNKQNTLNQDSYENKNSKLREYKKINALKP